MLGLLHQPNSSMKRTEEKKPGGIFRIKPRKMVAGFVDLLSSTSSSSRNKKNSPRSRSSPHHQRKHSAPASSNYAVKPVTSEPQPVAKEPQMGPNELQQSQSTSMIGKFYVVQSVASPSPCSDQNAHPQKTYQEPLSKVQRPVPQYKEPNQRSTSVQMSDFKLQKFAQQFDAALKIDRRGGKCGEDGNVWE